MSQAFIFVRTQLDCDHLEEYFLAVGSGALSTGGGGGRGKFAGKVEKGVENMYSCVVLHGGRSQAERQGNLDAFKDGDVRFLICTDVAARGLDIKGMPVWNDPHFPICRPTPCSVLSI